MQTNQQLGRMLSGGYLLQGDTCTPPCTCTAVRQHGLCGHIQPGTAIQANMHGRQLARTDAMRARPGCVYRQETVLALAKHPTEHIERRSTAAWRVGYRTQEPKVMPAAWHCVLLLVFTCCRLRRPCSPAAGTCTAHAAPDSRGSSWTPAATQHPQTRGPPAHQETGRAVLQLTKRSSLLSCSAQQLSTAALSACHLWWSTVPVRRPLIS